MIDTLWSTYVLYAHHGPWDGNDHPGGWWWLWRLGMFLFWIVVIALLIWWFRRGGPRGWQGRERTGIERAQDILAERFARGEISGEEYRERLQQLQSMTSITS